MGILNVTPDSFFEGHLNRGISNMLQLAEQMLKDGASIIDIGGQSTRPGSDRISEDEELFRVIPLVQAISDKFPEAVLSIDTYQSKVAQESIENGAHIVNDISGGMMDTNMINTVASFKNVPFICMHMKGTPNNMQSLAEYDDVVKDVLDFFILKTEECRKAGIHDVILDPGFGFGKTISHNFSLLKKLSAFKMLNTPLMVGVSRKSTVYKTLNISANEALNGTTVLNTIALLNGANILRVHDVKEAKEAVLLMNAYNDI
jgi:dihydropteroate synthase